MAGLGFHFCTEAFSSCDEWGYSLVGGVGFSLQWLLLLQSSGPRVCSLQWLWPTGLADPQLVESSETRDRTGVLALAGRLLATGKSSVCVFNIHF